jgi:hypothetical protein
MIALSLFPLLIGACLTTIDGGKAEAERGGRMADLVRGADRALSTLTSELERSGFTSVDGVDYPFFVDGAALDDAPALHRHAEANAAADAAVTRLAKSCSSSRRTRTTTAGPTSPTRC